MKLNKDLIIVIVLYNSSDLIFKCLEKLVNFEIIIVDNGKNKHLINQLKNYQNIIKIVSKNKNLGFGNAINYAYTFINKDYFLVLNPDVIIDENSIIELLKTSKKHENCAISAPYVKTDKDSYGILPEKGKGIKRSYDQNTIANRLDNLEPSGSFCVDVTKGCSMLINSLHFKNVGMFSKEYFLFWEEIDLCRKFLKNRLSVIVNPKATAYHTAGSSGKNNLSEFIIKTFYSEKSPLYYFKVKKNSLNLYKNMIKYIYRSITYLFILNLKNSLKNIIKLAANLSFIIGK